jgi:hypothetical protein
MKKIVDISIQDGERTYHEYYLVSNKTEANRNLKLHITFETDAWVDSIKDVTDKEIKILQKFGVI